MKGCGVKAKLDKVRITEGGDGGNVGEMETFQLMDKIGLWLMDVSSEELEG